MRNPKTAVDTHFIVKRDGRVVEWNADKIQIAVAKACKAVHLNDEHTEWLSQFVRNRVETEIAYKREKDVKYIPYIEDVQNFVEKQLMLAGEHLVLRSYIIYRNDQHRTRADKHTTINVVKLINEYMDRTDWRAAENANMAHSFQAMMLHIGGTVQAKYMLNYYPEEVMNAHDNGFIHIHDLSFMAGYCAGWSLRDLLLEGIYKKGESTAAPAKHFDTITGQIVNFLGTLQNEWAKA